MIESIAGKMGCSAETLRKWVRQAESDPGVHTGPTSSGDRWAALEPLYQGVRYAFGRLGKDVARGLTVRTDWGPQYTAHAFGAERERRGSSPPWCRVLGRRCAGARAICAPSSCASGRGAER